MNTPDLIEYLRIHRDEYVDEIPDFNASGDRGEMDNRPKYKVQKNWFQGVMGALENACNHGQITDLGIGQRVDALVAHIGSDEFHERPTKRDDIDAANIIITDVISHLSSTLTDTNS